MCRCKPASCGLPVFVYRLRLSQAHAQLLALRIGVRVTVVDNGPGIPADVLPNIFNPFYTTKPPGSGTGMGLSVVHSLVSDAGGAVSVSSEVGEGTSFILELPSAGDESEDDSHEELAEREPKQQ